MAAGKQRHMLSLTTGLWAAGLRAAQMGAMLLVGHCFPHHNPVMEDDPLAGLVAWDSLWFVAIAKHGYTVPQALAFLPGMPFLIKHLTQLGVLLTWPILAGLTAMLQQDILPLMTKGALAISDVGAAVSLCLTPSAAHFSALYSETPSCFLSTLCVWLCVRAGQGHGSRRSTYGLVALATGAAALASLLRSNGLLLVGFVGCSLLRLSTTTSSLLLHGAASVLAVAVTALPVHLHLRNTSRALGEPSGQLELLPAYSAVQRRFWGVGLLQYYQPRNIPRFLLMAPSLAAWGMAAFKILSRSRFTLTSLARPWALPWGVVVCVHAAVLALGCLLAANVEILPRLLWAASPIPVIALVPGWMRMVLVAMGIGGMWLFALHYAYT